MLCMWGSSSMGYKLAGFDVIGCNDKCPKRQSSQRYLIYKQGGWEHQYIMYKCIDYSLLKT